MVTDEAMDADAAMAALRRVVLADPSLHARLGAIVFPDAYLDALTAIATAHGIATSPEMLRSATRPDPLGLDRFLPNATTLDRWPAPGWLPARSVPTGGAPAFDWGWFGAASLDLPFYEDSVRRFMSRPFNRMFKTRTDAQALVAGMGVADGPPPSGFIHHMSRCGSTLIAQMLAADPDHVVLSEAEPLDAVVRWALESDATPADQVALLRAVVAALGRDRSGHTRRVFFKLDSWHVMALPLFRAAFPDTPWVFAYRNPVEVLVSQQRERGIHTVAGLLPTRIVDIPGAEGMALDLYAARVLALMGETVLEHWPLGGGLLVDYSEMPNAIVDRIAPHFGFMPDAAQRAAMATVAMRSAKVPDQPFVPDTAEKRRAATPEIAQAARDIVDPVHVRLEALRKSTMMDQMASE